MTITLREIAEWVQGEVVGDGDTIIHGAKPINDAQKGDITFVESDRHYSSLHSSNASAAIVLPPSIANGKPLIKVQDPLKAFVIVVQKLANRPVRKLGGIHPSVQIHPSSIVGADACIGPFVSIGEGCVIGARCRLLAGVSIGHDCQLGDDVTLHPHVVLYDGCNIGNRVTIHANTVIGADGFGYRPSQGIHVKVPQLGNVEIAEDVEIGACSTIDRGTFGPTRIGTGTKIDNLVMIAHNCQIGRHNLLVAQVGIAGSCTTGDHVVMAGQVGVADHILVGDRVVVFAKSGITKDIESDEKVRGFPARSDKEQLRMMATLEKLPEIRRDIRQIKQQLHLEETTEHDLSVSE